MKFGKLVDTIPEVMILGAAVAMGLSAFVGYVEKWTLPDTIWWMWVTFFTVGYGDLSPHTVTGRMLAMALMLWSWVIALLLAGQVAARLIVDSDAWTHDEQEAVKQALTRIEKKLGISDE